MWRFKQWRRQRLLKRVQLPAGLANNIIARIPVLRHLNADERARLTDLAVLFLHDKAVEPVQGLELDDAGRLTLALQACLPILNLDLDWYDGWISVIVYPGEFVPERETTDAAGVVHRTHRPLVGEAWLRGPVILSWPEIAGAGIRYHGNVVIHELAHKLDMLNGSPNGQPPLHRDMRGADWSAALSAAYQDLIHHLARGIRPPIDPYAAQNPAEFFAVVSETFFATPDVLQHAYPAVYAQLAAFYRQDPGARNASASSINGS